MKYAETALPYILLLTILWQITELIIKKDKVFYRISEIAMFLFVISHKLLTINLRWIILAVFILFLFFSIKYRDAINP